jgi:hypothetical protein
VSDLVIFVALVGVLVAGSIAIGMIVARRIDRLMTAREDPPEDLAVTDKATEEGPAA